MSRPTRLPPASSTSRNLHNSFLQNELRNHKKKLTQRRYRLSDFMDERDPGARTAVFRAGRVGWMCDICEPQVVARFRESRKRPNNQQ